MRSAAKKECSKCGKEWCFKAHAASLIPLDPLPLVLLSQKRVFIHLRPYLSAILVYLPNGGTADLDLTEAAGKFSVKWFNPREGGVPTIKGAASLNGGSKGTLTAPSADDWLAVIAKETASTK